MRAAGAETVTEVMTFGLAVTEAGPDTAGCPAVVGWTVAVMVAVVGQATGAAQEAVTIPAVAPTKTAGLFEVQTAVDVTFPVAPLA